jgi:transcriptional regulator with PAS, ATPase and Fis domain
MKHALQRLIRQTGPEATLEALAELVQGLHPEAGLYLLDAEARVAWWGPACERLSGRREAQVLGQPDPVVPSQDPGLLDATGRLIRVRRLGVPLGEGELVVLRRQQRPQVEATPAEPVGITPRSFHGLLSQDPGMHAAFQIIQNAAETDASVLMRGESGTGKELAARALHAESHRRDGPLLAVNCAALSPTLLESELFGHVRGAFTGAVRDRKGLFERADGGSLFLDEVAELPMDLQAKLLRVLQDRVILPVGGSRPIHVDIRLIAATHSGLRRRVAEGAFREDLMYRLRVVPIFLPPLRERRGDVELLLWHFIEEHNLRGPRRIERIHPKAMKLMLDHDWPGNVRELLNVVQYAFAVGRGRELLPSELPPEFRELRPIRARPKATEEQRIREALEQSGGHIGRAAELLGVSRPTFWRKRRKHGL